MRTLEHFIHLKNDRMVCKNIPMPKTVCKKILSDTWETSTTSALLTPALASNHRFKREYMVAAVGVRAVIFRILTHSPCTPSPGSIAANICASITPSCASCPSHCPRLLLMPCHEVHRRYRLASVLLAVGFYVVVRGRPRALLP